MSTTDQKEQLRAPAVQRQPRGSGRPADHWSSAYARRLLATDTAAVVVAVSVAYAIRFDVDGLPKVSGQFSPTYLSVSLVLMAAWLLVLSLGHTRDRRLIGTGPDEYSRVYATTWRLFAAVAVIGFLFHMSIGRGYLAIAAPLGLTLLLASRFGWRQWLHGQRDSGAYAANVLVVGHRPKVARLIEILHRNPRAGYRVVGVCVASGEVADGESVLGVPVYGSMDDAAAVAGRIGADAVAVSGADAITSEAVRRLGWDLEGTGVDLALTLAMLDVAGPRVLMHPVNGLPLMYVDEPRFNGPKYVLKSVFDWVGALALVTLLSPVLLLAALLVATSSRGPIFFLQERIGRDGRGFRVFKFRSMVVDAQEQLVKVLADEGTPSIGMFYKLKDDPRVTAVGRVLRKYSIDELPQLFNVLLGQMSLVGPRPQVAVEVAQYDRQAGRRLLVRPGMTGLWQVSGRSNLSVEDGIRMDVYYVENWSLFGDLLILARTFRAVVASRGAY